METALIWTVVVVLIVPAALFGNWLGWKLGEGLDRLSGRPSKAEVARRLAQLDQSRARLKKASPKVDRTGKTCQKHGHLGAESWGKTWGYCKRCEFTVHRESGQVLYFGEFHRKVPAHDEEAEARSAEWAKDYTERTHRNITQLVEAEAEGRDTAALEREQRKLRAEQRRAFGFEDLAGPASR